MEVNLQSTISYYFSEFLSIYPHLKLGYLGYKIFSYRFFVMNKRVPLNFLILVIMIGAVGMLATDIYLPALPEMSEYFHCTQSDIQGSFTVFLLGLAGCQLIYGGLCDYFGRKPVMIFGLMLFITASILCSVVESLSSFLFFRVLQAIGGGAGSVVSRAIITASYDRTQAVKVFTTTFPIIGLSAAIAPFFGGYLTYYFGWKSTFYFVAAYGVIALITVLIFFKDKEKKGKVAKEEMIKGIVDKEHKIDSRFSSQLLNVLKGYKEVIMNADFLGYSLIVSAGFSAFRSFTAESPFVFNKHGYGPDEMGHFYIALSAAYLIGNLIAKKLVGNMNLERVLSIGFGFLCLGGIALYLGSHYVDFSPYMIILPMAMVTLGNGFLFPTGSAGALSSVPVNISGTASGLVGALQFVLAAICIHWIGGFCEGHAPYLSIFIGSIIFVGLCSFLILLLRRSRTELTLT